MSLIHGARGQVESPHDGVIRAVQGELQGGRPVERADLKNGSCVAGPYERAEAEQFDGRGIAIGKWKELHHYMSRLDAQISQAAHWDRSFAYLCRPHGLQFAAKRGSPCRSEERINREPPGQITTE